MTTGSGVGHPLNLNPTGDQGRLRRRTVEVRETSPRVDTDLRVDLETRTRGVRGNIGILSYYVRKKQKELIQTQRNNLWFTILYFRVENTYTYTYNEIFFVRKVKRPSHPVVQELVVLSFVRENTKIYSLGR